MGAFNFRVVIHTAPEVEEITSMSVFTNQQSSTRCSVKDIPVMTVPLRSLNLHVSKWVLVATPIHGTILIEAKETPAGSIRTQSHIDGEQNVLPPCRHRADRVSEKELTYE